MVGGRAGKLAVVRTDSSVEEVKSRLDIVDVVGSYVRLSRAGTEMRGLCPFHTEHTPSFYVSPEKQVWVCHGCHEGGDVITFVEKIEHLDFRGALEELARRTGVELRPEEPASPQELRRRRQREQVLRLNQLAANFYHEVLLNHAAGGPGRASLEARGVSQADMAAFGLGYAPAGSSLDNLVRFLRRHQGDDGDIAAAGLARGRSGRLEDFFRARLVIPIRDERGRVVGFGGRALGDDQPKYLNTRTTSVFDKSAVLFGLDRAREQIYRERRAVLMEGYFDVVGAHRAGIRSAISTSGTALTEVQVRLLRRFADEVVLCFDGDAAGQRAGQAAVGLVVRAGMGCRLLTLPAGTDPDDLSRSDPAQLRELVDEAPPAWEVLIDQALGEPAHQSTAQRQAALSRAMTVLGRIPEASIRALYSERVGRRLGVAADRILEDVERGARRDPGKLPLRSLSAAPGGNSTLGVSAHLLGLLRLRPQLVTEVQDRYKVRRDDFADPGAGALFQAMVERAPEHLDPSELGPELQGKLEQLPKEGFPELDDLENGHRLRRALEDCVRAVRVEALERRVTAIESRLGGFKHHREPEVPALVAEMDRLRRQIERLRQGEVLET